MRRISSVSHLVRNEKVIPDYTRDRAEALLLLARATIEKDDYVVDEEDVDSRSYNDGARKPSASSPNEALEEGIAHLRAAAEVVMIKVYNKDVTVWSH